MNKKIPSGAVIGAVLTLLAGAMLAVTVTDVLAAAGPPSAPSSGRPPNSPPRSAGRPTISTMHARRARKLSPRDYSRCMQTCVNLGERLDVCLHSCGG